MTRSTTQHDVLAPSEHPGDYLRKRQSELNQRYREQPEAARTIDAAHTRARGAPARDPLHNGVTLGTRAEGSMDTAVHHKLGGLHDLPVPGDLLAAALACCLDQSIRMVANQLRVHLESLEVDVEAEVDVRGTLCVDAEVPVGFQHMRTEVRMEVAPDTRQREVELLKQFAEHCCVVTQTLRKGVPLDVAFYVFGAT